MTIFLKKPRLFKILIVQIMLVLSACSTGETVITPILPTETRVAPEFTATRVSTHTPSLQPNPSSTPPKNQTDSRAALNTANLPKNIPTDCMEKQFKNITISPGQADKTYIVNGNQVIYPILICTNGYDYRSDYNWAFLLNLTSNIQPNLYMQYWSHPDSSTTSGRGENGAIYPFRYNDR